MPTYVVLFNWTEQGVKNARDTVNRYRQARSSFEEMGIRFLATYWTAGRYDIVSLIEGPDDQTTSAALLKLAGSGNVRTETLRAFSEQEMEQIIGRMS